MQIDRCVCFQVRFAELKTLAETTAARDIPSLQAHCTFGQRCKLCHPYVRRMLATGETVFHEVIQS
ncbi:MAG: (2Fe-2S)-binding protein [Bacteroidota bacterium]